MDGQKTARPHVHIIQSIHMDTNKPQTRSQYNKYILYICTWEGSSQLRKFYIKKNLSKTEHIRYKYSNFLIYWISYHFDHHFNWEVEVDNIVTDLSKLINFIDLNAFVCPLFIFDSNFILNLVRPSELPWFCHGYHKIFQWKVCSSPKLFSAQTLIMHLQGKVEAETHMYYVHYTALLQ